MKTAYVIKESAAQMPSSNKFGRYGKIAVMEMECDESGQPRKPAMISERAKGCVRVVEIWDRLSMGTKRPYGPKSAYARAMAEARAMIETLSA
jgi:hypothetical protein